MARQAEKVTSGRADGLALATASIAHYSKRRQLDLQSCRLLRRALPLIFQRLSAIGLFLTTPRHDRAAKAKCDACLCCSFAEEAKGLALPRHCPQLGRS